MNLHLAEVTDSNDDEQAVEFIRKQKLKMLVRSTTPEFSFTSAESADIIMKSAET